jgi:hypothetical protein
VTRTRTSTQPPDQLTHSPSLVHQCVITADDDAIAAVTTAVAAGLSITLDSGAIVKGYTPASVQMLFAVSAFDIHPTRFGATAVAALLSRAGVNSALVVDFGVWSGSVVVQVNFANANGAGNKMRTAISSGLVEATYDGATYNAFYAAGNSTAPTPMPTMSPTAPTQAPTAPTPAPTEAPTAPTSVPTRAPTAPARDVPFSASNPGMELNHIKLMVAAGAAVIVSGSVLLVLVGTSIHQCFRRRDPKAESLAMRFIDYDAEEICDPANTSPTPLSPLSMDRRGRGAKTAAKNRLNNGYGAVDSTPGAAVATTVFGSNGNYITLGGGARNTSGASRDDIYGGIEIPSDDESSPMFGEI